MRQNSRELQYYAVLYCSTVYYVQAGFSEFKIEKKLPEEEVCWVSFCEEPGLFHLRAMAKELSRLLFNLREKQLALFPQRRGDAELS